MEITPMIAGVIVLAVILLMFAAAGIIVAVTSSRAKKQRRNSLPQGGDISEFSRSMTRRFDSEDRL